MAGTGLLMRQLTCLPLDAAGFGPYGTVVDTVGAQVELINDGTTRRYSDLARVDLLGPGRDPVLGIYQASARRLPLRLLRLERHAQASQVFMPLGQHRFIIVVAPGDQEPVWSSISAFLSSPGQGVCLRRGCWHHGLVALGEGDCFLVIEGGDYRNDTSEVDAPETIELLAPR